MTSAELFHLARRYTFAFGRGYLSTFLSSLSTVGLVLAIGLLISVLSVMNGFDKEMRQRILSLVPHVSILSHSGLTEWPLLAQQIQTNTHVASVRPFVHFDAMFVHGEAIETARGLGITTQADKDPLKPFVQDDAYQHFADAQNGLLLGKPLAQRLGVTVGDTLTLIAPILETGSRGAARFEQLVLKGIVDTGTELDEALALVSLPVASRLAGLDGRISGLQVELQDIFNANRVAWELVKDLQPGLYSTTWMQTHGNLYAAIQMSRNLVSILLFSIIVVAAFNVVSSLVLVVFDKQGDIAILRTMGASQMDVAKVFMLQGALIGLVGVVLGCLVGVVFSLLIPNLVATLEGLLNYRFLNTDVYPVSFLPVDVRMSDVLTVAAIAFAMCVLAAVYPALRAARLAPAAILHEQSA